MYACKSGGGGSSSTGEKKSRLPVLRVELCQAGEDLASILVQDLFHVIVREDARLLGRIVPRQVCIVVKAHSVRIVSGVEEVFNGDVQVFDQRVLHRAGDAGVQIDVGGAQDLSERLAGVRLGDDIVQVLGSDAVGEERERAAIVREEEADVRRSQ